MAASNNGRFDQTNTGHQQQQQQQHAQQQAKIYTGYESFKHNAALAMLVIAPVLVAIPPRKLDLYTFSLTGAFVASANQLTVEQTGRGLLSQFKNPATRLSPSPSQPRVIVLEEQTENRQRQQRLLEEKVSSVPDEMVRRRTTTNNMGVVGSIEEKAKDIWMGAETEGWKERRLKEEQEKLDNGEGYGSMIMDQIWEVWNWGEKKGQELQKKDEEVLRHREEPSQKSKTTDGR